MSKAMLYVKNEPHLNTRRKFRRLSVKEPRQFRKTFRLKSAISTYRGTCHVWSGSMGGKSKSMGQSYAYPVEVTSGSWKVSLLPRKLRLTFMEVFVDTFVRGIATRKFPFTVKTKQVSHLSIVRGRWFNSSRTDSGSEWQCVEVAGKYGTHWRQVN